jgi:2-polyprenyl-6-methoxyphenol hydroxylase-like FAD-dependent oxidoreductase
MSELPGRSEVLVVGAGPVGLAVAASLSGHGHDVTVVDRQATGANTSRAAVVHARTLEMLERIGVSKQLAGLGIQAPQFSIRDGDRELVPVRFDRLATDYPYTLMVPQNITEQVLLDRLEELGGSVHRPYLATGVSQTADGAEVTLDSGDTIKAQYVVAADGMNSKIRELAGLGHDGNALSLSFTLADVRVEGGLPADQVLLFFSAPGMLVVAPLPDGSFRLVAEVDDAPEQPFRAVCGSAHGCAPECLLAYRNCRVGVIYRRTPRRLVIERQLDRLVAPRVQAFPAARVAHAEVRRQEVVFRPEGERVQQQSAAVGVANEQGRLAQLVRPSCRPGCGSCRARSRRISALGVCPRERELDVGGRHRGARRDDPARRVHRQVLALVACRRCRFFVRSDSRRRRVLRVRRARPRVKSRPGAGFVCCDELRAGGRSYAYDLDYRADARDA